VPGKLTSRPFATGPRAPKSVSHAESRVASVASGFSRKRLAAEGQQGALRFADDVARGGTKEQEVHGGPTAYAEHDPSRCAVGRAERPSEQRVGRRIPVQQRIQVQGPGQRIRSIEHRRLRWCDRGAVALCDNRQRPDARDGEGQTAVTNRGGVLEMSATTSLDPLWSIEPMRYSRARPSTTSRK
jgi:hypothetical protein